MREHENEPRIKIRNYELNTISARIEEFQRILIGLVCYGISYVLPLRIFISRVFTLYIIRLHISKRREFKFPN